MVLFGSHIGIYRKYKSHKQAEWYCIMFPIFLFSFSVKRIAINLQYIRKTKFSVTCSVWPVFCYRVAGDEGSGSGSGSGCTEVYPTDMDVAATEAPVVEADRSEPVDDSALHCAPSVALPTILALSALALHRQWR